MNTVLVPKKRAGEAAIGFRFLGRYTASLLSSLRWCLCLLKVRRFPAVEGELISESEPLGDAVSACNEAGGGVIGVVVDIIVVILLVFLFRLVKFATGKDASEEDEDDKNGLKLVNEFERVERGEFEGDGDEDGEDENEKGLPLIEVDALVVCK